MESLIEYESESKKMLPVYPNPRRRQHASTGFGRRAMAVFDPEPTLPEFHQLGLTSIQSGHWLENTPAPKEQPCTAEIA
jgi:hypothetical protein